MYTTEMMKWSDFAKTLLRSVNVMVFWGVGLLLLIKLGFDGQFTCHFKPRRSPFMFQQLRVSQCHKLLVDYPESHNLLVNNLISFVTCYWIGYLAY